MLTWLFKKRGGAAATVATPAPLSSARGSAAPRAVAAKVVEPPAAVDWAAPLQAALGDDAALLQLAQSATGLDTKLAAVAALRSEAALKQAERAFRSHDRKVHRLAKQRLEAALTQRTARAQAEALLVRTQALLDEALVPVNHLVTLDRDWEALPVEALEPAQTAAFTALRARLGSQLRERTDAQQQLKHWTAEAQRLRAQWLPLLRQAAAGGTAADASALGQALQAALDARPPLSASAELLEALAQAGRAAAAVHACLAQLEAPPLDGDEPAAWPVDVQGLDAELVASLVQRQAQWLLIHRPPPPAPAPAPQRPARTPRHAPLDATQRQVLQDLLQDLLQQAEAARDEGQLGEMQRHLQAFESALVATGAALPDALRARQQALWAEQVRLRDWQQWGGARARDDLVAEAVVLEQVTLAATPAAPPATAPTDPDAVAAAPEASPAAPTRAAGHAPKLNLQAHSEAIRDLRQRWKALDRTGAAASQAQWQHFDGALQAAHQPLAVQQAAQQAARLDNLAARESLLAALESHALTDSAASGDAAADWRAVLRELDRFNSEWRKLGPVEHTVPRAAQAGLQQRLQAALARIETPLQAARTAAVAEREALIRQAQGLAPAGASAPSPDAARHVRDLQARWQDQARQLPLPRGLENALWARFKAATDAVFAQREAAIAARDAELATNLAQTQALVQRLLDLGPETPASEIERTLAEVDRGWRQGGELPRGALDGINGLSGLDQQYHGARAAAAQHIGAAVRQRWQALCDTLQARLALCEAREDAAGNDPSAADRVAHWAQLPPLPSGWQQPLAQRWGAPVKIAEPPAAAVDEWLLRLETALGLPAAPEWQAARQALKLRALKDTLEGRGATKDGPSEQAAWLQSLLRQPGLDAARRTRLAALLAALRESQPGALGLPAGQR